MPEQRTDKSSFQSKYGGGWVTAAQFLSELACSRKARQKGTTLPARFWEAGPWKREFLIQVRHANSLLKIYTAEAVLRALNTRDGQKIYSLSAKWLDPLIQQEEAVLKKQQEALCAAPVPETPIEKPAEPLRPQHVASPSLLSKLRDL